MTPFYLFTLFLMGGQKHHIRQRVRMSCSNVTGLKPSAISMRNRQSMLSPNFDSSGNYFFGKSGQTSNLDQRNTTGDFVNLPLPVIKPVAIQVVLPAKFNLGKAAGLPLRKHAFPVVPFFFAFNGSAFFHQ
jgi:hypothetical protein